MSNASCIVGAGYSYIAGLPLAKDLLTSGLTYYTAQQQKHIDAVWQSHANWQGQNPNRSPEEYLSDLYTGLLTLSPNYVPFDWAVELVLMVLATPPRGAAASGYQSSRYIPELISPTYCGVHTEFWRTVLACFDEVSVVTTNYDLLVERALRHKPMKRVFGPGFYYGGLPHPQVAIGTGTERYGRPKQLRLLGRIPIYKIHGSLNWAQEQDEIALYQDMRAAFRQNSRAAIVPPVAEKKTPPWLKNVWDKAEAELSKSSTWIVCGYSLPEYDYAIKDLFQRSGQAVKTVYILDPLSLSSDIAARWQAVAPRAEVVPLKGLPEGITELIHLTT